MLVTVQRDEQQAHFELRAGFELPVVALITQDELVLTSYNFV